VNQILTLNHVRKSCDGKVALACGKITGETD
jgi:hypothetical protein